MKADRLDAEARIAIERRARIQELRRLGTEPADLVGRSLRELDEIKRRTVRDLMGAPGPG